MKNEEVERLFRENYRRMFLVAVFLLHDEAEGKDVVHDVFETVMRNGIELRGETASGYLLSSTRNRCLNRLRSMRIKEKVANEYVIFSNLESVTDEDASEERIATLNAGISLLQPPVRKKNHRDALQAGPEIQGNRSKARNQRDRSVQTSQTGYGQSSFSVN